MAIFWGPFSKGAFIPQKWDMLPPFSHNSSSFKDICFLIKLKVLPGSLYVFNGLLNMPIPTYLMKRTVERQLGIESGLCKS
jgi:hypothetical protein